LSPEKNLPGYVPTLGTGGEKGGGSGSSSWKRRKKGQSTLVI